MKKNNLFFDSAIHLKVALLVLGILLLGPFSSFSLEIIQQTPWTEGSEKHQGITRDYANREARIAWDNLLGDWCDKNDSPQGDAAYSETSIIKPGDRELAIDVLELIQEYARKNIRYGDIILTTLGSGGPTKFHSRETKDPSQAPRLVLTSNGETIHLKPVADAYNAKSTYKGMGLASHLFVSPDRNAFLRFELPVIDHIQSASLQLSIIKQYATPSKIYVFRSCYIKNKKDIPQHHGIAKKYPGDKGIQSHPSVIFTDMFDGGSWSETPWTYGYDRETLSRTSKDPENLFVPLDGNALKVTIPKDSTMGMEMAYVFKTELSKEPEEIYFRYYLRFADNWDPIIDGKLPGISGTYGKGGWGGRKSIGTNGWSARGSFNIQLAGNDPLAKKIPIGNYVYHADQKGTYGDKFSWNERYLGSLNKNQWYCIEQYVRLNTPEKNDGVLKTWVDGRVALEKNRMRFRKIPDLKIEKIWMNVYHGGKLPVDKDISLYIDNVVVGTEYIGPMEK